MHDSKMFREAVSEKRLLNVVKEVSNFHRIQASPMFREAAEHVKKICDGYGLEARILSYKADPKVWYLQSKMFQEWSVKAATLDLVDPETRLCDYSSEPISLIQKSYPIDLRKKPAELILLDEGPDEAAYPDIDFTGKWVFVRQHISNFDWVYRRGALGLVTDFIMETPSRKRSDLYESLTYTSYWHTHLKDEPQRRGFVLSPKAGDRLAELCRKKWKEEHAYLRVRPFIDSKLYNGHIEAVEAVIRGKDEKNVYLTAHLCHPRSSCNDNASGVSASLEAMNVINTLIREKKLKKPKHTIRMVLIPEYTGTFAYLSDHNDYENGLGAMNLDMVGGKQTRFYGPITLTKTPLAAPSLISELSAWAMAEAGKEAVSHGGEPIAMTNHTTAPHSGGSDHTVYCDPTIDIPCCMLGQWPDLNYHTATDTLDVIDPSVLKFSCLTAVNFAWALANLTAKDLPYVFEELDKNIIEEKTRLAGMYLGGTIGRDMFGSALYRYRQYYLDCVKTAVKLTGKTDVSAQLKHVEDMFDSWIAYYGVSDSWPVYEELTSVYRRNAVGPYHQLSDFRGLGHDDAIDAYEASKKDRAYNLESAAVNYIDGNRTAAEIVKLVSLECHKDVKEQVLNYLNVLEELGLIAKA